MDAERALLSKIAQTGKGLDKMLEHGIGVEHFADEDNAALWNFLVSHTEKYGKQPGTTLIMERFPEWNFEISDQPLIYLRDRLLRQIEGRESLAFAEELTRARYRAEDL